VPSSLNELAAALVAIDSVNPAHPFVELVGRVAEAGEYVGALLWTDPALIADTGIPTVLFGRVGEGAHATVEWVDLPSLDRVREVVGRVAAEWCA
jgi:acetylornithine deacetylase/succinyl-diaminopimelate desuccinylase-like protein